MSSTGFESADDVDISSTELEDSSTEFESACDVDMSDVSVFALLG